MHGMALLLFVAVSPSCVSMSPIISMYIQPFRSLHIMSLSLSPVVVIVCPKQGLVLPIYKSYRLGDQLLIYVVILHVPWDYFTISVKLKNGFLLAHLQGFICSEQ